MKLVCFQILDFDFINLLIVKQNLLRPSPDYSILVLISRAVFLNRGSSELWGSAGILQGFRQISIISRPIILSRLTFCLFCLSCNYFVVKSFKKMFFTSKRVPQGSQRVPHWEKGWETPLQRLIIKIRKKFCHFIIIILSW